MYKSSIRLRSVAIGAHGGSYSIYNALAVASKNLDITHKPDFTNTEPAAKIGPFPQWSDKKKIVAMDPYGHLAPWLFKETMDKDDVEIRPTIAITRAHMKVPEMENSVKEGRITVDGKICVSEQGEIAVTKVAVEPVWYLPGVAERFNIGKFRTPQHMLLLTLVPDEGILRRTLFEETGGSYPELITRHDIKLFLPPIGGLTVYIFGDPAKMSDPNSKLALRIHDECNGSDVFGSDICTCRPYLTFGIEEAVKEAQNGGSGVVIYFRKEGRALGEVTKYLVYNARKRGEDRASEYFKRTENIAGVKDMRFQALMPDILHWLGITKIDRMLSMSNMKHDAIVEQGIPIHERVPIPDDMIPADSRVEIDAKIQAGYCTYFPSSGHLIHSAPDHRLLQCAWVRSTNTLMLTPAVTTGHVMSMDELANVKGRGWEDIDVSGIRLVIICSALQTLTPCSTDYACKRHGKRSSGAPLMHAGTARLDLLVLTCSEMRVTTFSAKPDPSTGLDGRSPQLPDKHRCRNRISIHRERSRMSGVRCCVVCFSRDYYPGQRHLSSH
jgi:GTP cyclohydrolase II